MRTDDQKRHDFLHGHLYWYKPLSAEQLTHILDVYGDHNIELSRVNADLGELVQAGRVAYLANEHGVGWVKLSECCAICGEPHPNWTCPHRDTPICDDCGERPCLCADPAYIAHQAAEWAGVVKALEELATMLDPEPVALDFNNGRTFVLRVDYRYPIIDRIRARRSSTAHVPALDRMSEAYR